MKVCKFEECGRPVRAKGYCLTHYEQERTGRPLRPINKHTRFPEPAPGKKICTICLRVLDKQEDFYHYGTRTYARCKKCHSEWNMRRRREAAA